MDSWDKSDFTIIKDQWQDDIDDVEDVWDAEEIDEPKAPSKQQLTERKPTAPAPKKTPQAVSKAKKVEEPVESALERKLRLQKLQEEADLDNASHLFGNEFMVKTGEEGKATAVVAAAVAAKQVDWLDALNPSTQLDFNNMSDHLCKRLRAFEDSKFYVSFVENLAKALLANKDVPEVRKIAGTLSDLAALKQKEKLATGKKVPPSLGGAKKGGRSDFADYGDFDDDGDGFD